VLTGDAADALRLSAASLRLEMRNPRPDRMIIRRALARIDHLSDLFAAGSNGNVIKAQLSDLIRSFRRPLIESDEPTPTTAEAEA
jgi:hypothetical protein